MYADRGLQGATSDAPKQKHSALCTAQVPWSIRSPVAKLQEQLGPGLFASVAFFVSPWADFDSLVHEAEPHYPETDVTAYTTAGEITQSGHDEDTVVAIGFPQDKFSSQSVILENIDALDIQSETDRVALQRLGLQHRDQSTPHEFAFLMVDGLSLSQDTLTAALAPAVGNMPVFGGSAGDGVGFQMTMVALKVQSGRLEDILSRLRNEVAATAAEKGLDLRFLASSLSVRSDAAYLRRVIQNLLTNAVRYASQGRVLLSVRRLGNSARIEVWDTGCGISKNEQTAVFQGSKRLSPNSAFTGLGLGLAIVERVCKALGHELGVWSEPGVGSCFSLNIPIDHAQMLPSETVAQLRMAPAGDLKRLFDFLVENDPALGMALSMVIEDLGGEGILAQSGEEALSRLHEIQLVPDAFLLDYQFDDNIREPICHVNCVRAMAMFAPP